MSALQKLFNLIHGCPKASHFKVKELNIYFNKSINPVYKLINLENINSLELQVEEDGKNYTLVAYITRGKEETGILLGTFETKKEAEYGLHKVKNQLFSGGKTLLTYAIGVVSIFVFINLTFGFVSSFKHDNSSSVPSISGLSGLSGLNNNTAGGSINMADMSKLQKQLLQQAIQQANQQGITVPGAAGMTGATAGAGNLQALMNGSGAMNNIVQQAIQQSQTGQGTGVPTGIQVPTTTPQAVEQSSTPGDELLKQIK